MESIEWQKCTQSKCPDLTNCIFECSDDSCLLNCIKVFKENHVSCPCEVRLDFFIRI